MAPLGVVSGVSVLLGNGDGTFQQAQSFAGGGLFTDPIISADFDGDEKPDLAIAHTHFFFDPSVSVLLNTTVRELRDVNPPSLGYPGDVTVDATSPEGAVASYEVTVVDDRDPNPQLSCAPPSGSTFPIGATDVECTATDASGNSIDASFPVIVRGANEQLTSLHNDVVALDIHQGTKNSLLSKLRDALEKLEANDEEGACGDLKAFTNHAKAQSGKKLTTEQADSLTEDANRIRDVLGC